MSSALVEVEVRRAIRRYVPAALHQVAAVMATLDQFEIDASIRSSAASLPDPLLRALDAIHLATALQLGSELQGFVTLRPEAVVRGSGCRSPHRESWPAVTSGTSSTWPGACMAAAVPSGESRKELGWPSECK